uniref:Uncharacterized protein n=1 Tax=Lepeophtheirus salmonis TaxID=72036 RepID=A0A0K2U2A1_LEPSM
MKGIYIYSDRGRRLKVREIASSVVISSWNPISIHLRPQMLRCELVILCFNFTILFDGKKYRSS